MFSNEAFAQNAEKYMDTVFRVAYGWLKNPDDALHHTCARAGRFLSRVRKIFSKNFAAAAAQLPRPSHILP